MPPLDSILEDDTMIPIRFRLVWVVLVMAIAAMLSGCATELPAPNPGFELNDQKSVVFGRAQFILNGHLLALDDATEKYQAQIITHVGSFAGLQALERNPWSPGKWAFRAITNKGGYFAITLPPGRYYIVEFSYLKLGPLVGLRTYMPILDIKPIKPFVTTFTVVPGQATYIGTMRHIMNDTTTDATRLITWELEIVDETPELTTWVRKEYPALERLSTVLAEKLPAN
jgi:hypothetical protein